jgi:hypothetical protein
MSPQGNTVMGRWDRSLELRGNPCRHDYAMLEELSFSRREAQAEADIAYEDWRVLATGDAYAVYRAAQDRADAAQDDLALMGALLLT